MTSLFLALAGVLNGLAYIFNKKLSFSKYHPATHTSLIQTLAGLIALPVLLYQFKIPTTPPYWFLTVISITTYGTGFYFGIKAYQTVDASIVGIVNRFNIVFASFIGLIYLAETYTLQSYIGLIFILIGSMLVVFEQGRAKLSKGIVFACLMALCYGLAAIFDKVLLNQFSPYTYVFVNNILVGFLFSLIPQARREALSLFKTHTLLVLGSASLSVLAWLIFLVVLQQGSVSTVYPIYDSMALIATVGVGIIWLKETKKLRQKLIGTLCIILGIFLLG